MKNYSSFSFGNSNSKELELLCDDLFEAFKNEEIKDILPSLPSQQDGTIHLNKKAWLAAMKGAAGGARVDSLNFLLAFKEFVKELKSEEVKENGTRNLGYIWGCFFSENKDFEDPNVIEFFKILLKEDFPINEMVYSRNNLRVLGALTLVEARSLLELLPNHMYSINGLSMNLEDEIEQLKNNSMLKAKEKEKFLTRVHSHSNPYSKEMPPLFHAINCGNLNVLNWYIKRKTKWATNFLEKSIATHALNRLLELENSSHRIKVMRTLAPHINWNNSIEKKEVIDFFTKNFIEKKALTSINHIYGYCIFSAAKFHLEDEFKYYVNSNHEVEMVGGLISNDEEMQSEEKTSYFGDFLLKLKDRFKKEKTNKEIDLSETSVTNQLNSRVDTKALARSSMRDYIKRKANEFEEKKELFSDWNFFNIIKNADVKKFLELEDIAYRELKLNSSVKYADVFNQWMFTLLCAKNVGYFNEQGGSVFAQNCTDSEVKLFLDKVIPKVKSEIMSHPLKTLNGLTLAHVCCILDDMPTLNLLHKKDKSLLCNINGMEHIISIGSCAVKARAMSCLEFLMNNLTEDLIYKESGDTIAYREHLIHSLVKEGLKLQSEDSAVFRDVIEQLVKNYPDIAMFRNQDGLNVVELMSENLEQLKLMSKNSKELLLEFEKLASWKEAMCLKMIKSGEDNDSVITEKEPKSKINKSNELGNDLEIKNNNEGNCLEKNELLVINEMGASDGQSRQTGKNVKDVESKKEIRIRRRL